MKFLNAFTALFLFILFGCSDAPLPLMEIVYDEQYPRWIKDDSIFTQQTSGITFIKSEGNVKHFLLADDIGRIHRLLIQNDTIFSLKTVSFSNEVNLFLNALTKPDLEEITYDPLTGEVFVSIEGNFPQIVPAGIYKTVFYQNNVFSDSIVSLEKLKIEPESEISRFQGDNTGFEGLAVDKNYFYIGLEGFVSNSIFADSTLLYIVSRNDLTIKKIINTNELGIHTICALYSDKVGSVFGIDRNNKKIFHFYLEDNREIIKFNLADLESKIPGYSQLLYAASFEGLTMDDENNFYLTDDPWKKFFIPSKEILSQLDEKTINNFRNYIPVIFKLKLK